MTSFCAESPSAFFDDDECMTTCADYDRGGRLGDTEGDTLQCRVQHALLAQDGDTSNCDHAGVSGGDNCTGPPTNE
jgi:hypothetical protein